jgi:hypothetical protein
VCLCGRDTCNGPSLPPKDLIDKDEDIIDIDEVVREMNEVKMAQPEPIASGASGGGQSGAAVSWMSSGAAASWTSSGGAAASGCGRRLAVIRRTVTGAQQTFVGLVLLLHLIAWFS